MRITDRLFRQAIEQLSIAFLTDELGRYAYVNQGWCDYMGHDPEEVIGTYAKDLTPTTGVVEVIKTHKPVSGYYVQDKNGRYLFNTYSPIFDGERFIGMVVIIFFTDMDNALTFADKINSMMSEIDFYKEQLRKLRGGKSSFE